MTSTPYQVGLGDDTRSSSRVLRPPGGGHTDIFGGDPEPPRGRRLVPAPGSAAANEAKARDAQAMRAAMNGTNGTETSIQNGGEAPEAQPDLAAAVVPAPEAQAQPEPVAKTEAPVAESAKAEPPRRQRVPPGGFSSGLW